MWSIRVYIRSLLKQIDGDTLAVDYEDTLPKRAEIHYFT